MFLFLNSKTKTVLVTAASVCCFLCAGRWPVAVHASPVLLAQWGQQVLSAQRLFGSWSQARCLMLSLLLGGNPECLWLLWSFSKAGGFCIDFNIEQEEKVRERVLVSKLMSVT